MACYFIRITIDAGVISEDAIKLIEFMGRVIAICVAARAIIEIICQAIAAQHRAIV